MDAAELAELFDLGRAVRISDGPVARGKRGEIWRLDTDAGRWAVKVPFDACTEDGVAAPTAFHEAARAAGVPAPALRRTPAGRVLAEAGGRPVRMYEWLDLAAPDRLLDPRLVGTTVAALHLAPDPHLLEARGPAGPGPWFAAPVGAGRWDELVARVSAIGAPFARRFAALRDELVALEEWLEPPGPLRTCHRDLWSDNVLATAAGGICVIDWENSGPADPSHELGCVLFEFARGDPDRARALVQAYDDAGGPGAVRRRGHFSMLIAQLGHLTEHAVVGWLTEPAGSSARAEAARSVQEVLDEPHDRGTLEDLLRAVGVTLRE